MLKGFLLLVALTITQVQAAPGGVCPVVTPCVTSSSQQSAATAFCSSYLSIPLSKTVSTSTSTVKGPRSTVTSTTTITSATSTRTLTFESTVTTGTTTVTSTPPCTTPASKVKRATSSEPACLASYTKSAKLSSACGCFSIAPSTSTKTKVVTTTSTPIRTIHSTITVGGRSTVSTTFTTSVEFTVTTVLSTPACSPTAVITDGSFEGIPQADLDVDNASDGNWQLIGGSSDASATFQSESTGGFLTPYGTQFVELQGASGTTTAVVHQFSYTLSGTFTLSVAYAVPVVNLNTISICKLFTVYDGTAQGISVQFDSSTTVQDWQTATGTFSPDSNGNLNIALTCSQALPGDSMTLLVDNVSLTAQ